MQRYDSKWWNKQTFAENERKIWTITWCKNYYHHLWMQQVYDKIRFNILKSPKSRGAKDTTEHSNSKYNGHFIFESMVFILFPYLKLSDSIETLYMDRIRYTCHMNSYVSQIKSIPWSVWYSQDQTTKVRCNFLISNTLNTLLFQI